MPHASSNTAVPHDSPCLAHFLLTSSAGCPANALSPQLSVPTLEAMLRSFQRNVDRKGYAAAVKAVEQDAARALGAAMDSAADTETDTVAVTRVPAAPAPATATATVAAPVAVASVAVVSVASVGPARQVPSAPSSPVRGEAAETVRPAKSYVSRTCCFFCAVECVVAGSFLCVLVRVG
jgi:hypothetical protein